MTFLPGTTASFERTKENFISWLNGRGSEVLAPTNPYEVMRFTGPLNVCVIYSNSKGQIKGEHWQNGADIAWNAFTSGSPWRARERTARSRKEAGRIDALAARDGWGCVFCGVDLSFEEATTEHFVPLTSSGPDTIANMMLAHRECNAEAGHLSAREKIELIIRKRGSGT